MDEQEFRFDSETIPLAEYRNVLMLLGKSNLNMISTMMAFMYMKLQDNDLVDEKTQELYEMSVRKIDTLVHVIDKSQSIND
jgi:hypothetical protein